MSLLRIAGAFVRKDFLQATTYRLHFVLGLASMLTMLLFLAFMSDFIGPLVGERLEPYGGDYFAFVVLGLGVVLFQGAALEQLTGRIREAQMVGTLEALLATRAPPSRIIVCLPAYDFLRTALKFVGYLGLGALFFGMRMSWQHWPIALLFLVLTLCAFGCLGLVVGGLTTAFKRTESINSLISGASFFLGGIYYPLSVLPPWARGPAQFLPITPAIEGLRIVLLGGGGWREALPQLLTLTAFVAVMLPLGIFVFRWSLARARRDGTLTQY